MSDSLNAHVVLHKLDKALPVKHHKSIIIVGSLSAAAQLIKDAYTELRTKDIDGMLAPNATAVIAAKEIATRLIEEGWEPLRSNPGFVQSQHTYGVFRRIKKLNLEVLSRRIDMNDHSNRSSR